MNQQDKIFRSTVTCFLLLLIISVSYTTSFSQTLNSNWNQDLQGVLQQFVNCKNPDPNSFNPCNKFVGNALEQVYGINDFYSTKSGRYMMAHEISDFLKESGKWTFLGHAYEQKALTEAQNLANAKNAVVAVYVNADNMGHVALILPGELRASGSWGFNVPNSASFFLSEPENSYVSKGLSYAFGRDLIRYVLLYARNY